MQTTKPPFPLNPRHTLICLLMLAPVIASAEESATNTGTTNKSVTSAKKTPVKKATDDNTVTEMQEMVISEKLQPRAKDVYRLPTTTESITSEKIDNTINAMTSSDVIKYLPSIQVRQRYIGDPNAPVGWRTSGTGASARGLIYSDGVMLSSPLGSNNGDTGSPLWNMVAPSEIDRVDVMYGPFASAYSGNSMGGVIDITTKMPTKFEVGGNIKSSWQDFGFYGKNKTYDSQEYSGNVGDKYKDFSFRFDYSHLDSHSEPITYYNPLLSTTPATPGDTVVTGAVANKNPYGKDALVMGEGNLNHTLQDTFKWKFGYDITKTIHVKYTLGLWTNAREGSFNSFLTDSRGNVINSGNVAINGKQYKLGDTSFGQTNQDQTHIFQGMRLHSDSGGVFDWDLNGSVVDFSTDNSRVSTQTPAKAAQSGAGTVTSLTGTGWNTADAKGIWRPATPLLGKHEVSFGFHHDGATLNNPVYTVTNWKDSSQGVIKQNSHGETQTEGYWAQDALDFNKKWNLTYGGRLENWHAYNGYNNTTTKFLSQPDQNDLEFSPKGKLTWKPIDRVETGFSIAKAYRFPTVTELFQTTTSTVSPFNLIVANPNLKPEEALSSELSNEYHFDDGKIRLSLFQEQVKNAIFTQTTAAPSGSGATTISAPSNVQEIQTYGIEFAGNKSNVGIEGLDLYGTTTWADSTITKNYATDAALALAGPTAANPNANQPTTGKDQPRVPKWRASGTIAYRPIEKLNTSISGRYSSQQSSQLNNTDINKSTYASGGNAYFIVDLHANYNITKQLTIASGIDNVTDRQVWLFHPFPARTYFAEIKYQY